MIVVVLAHPASVASKATHATCLRRRVIVRVIAVREEQRQWRSSRSRSVSDQWRSATSPVSGESAPGAASRIVRVSPFTQYENADVEPPLLIIETTVPERV